MRERGNFTVGILPIFLKQTGKIFFNYMFELEFFNKISD